VSGSISTKAYCLIPRCSSSIRTHDADADMKSTVAPVMGSGVGCAGERCLETRVVVAVGEIGDPLVKELVRAADKPVFASNQRRFLGNLCITNNLAFL
jgi:acyl-CoA reductase-like NAD-dependent aldehyde dehydrogenase